MFFPAASILRQSAGSLLAVGLACTVFTTAAPAELPRPNVLLICVDDLVPTLGCYGDTTAKTPNIDAMSQQAMVFRNHHCPWPVCGPSRASLTTSLMPEETNVLGFRKIRDKNYLPNVTTLPQHFRSFGYETAATGKFHDPRTVGTPTAISATFPDGVMDDGRTVDDPASWSVPYVNAGPSYAPATRTAVDAVDQPDSLYEDHVILTSGMALIDDLTTAGGTAPGNKPFFLAVGFKKPHLPFVAPKAWWDIYDRNAMPVAPFTALPGDSTAYNNATLTNNAELLGGGADPDNGYLPYSSTGLPPDLAQQRELLHGYYACVSFVDSLVGQLRTKLAATNDPNQLGKKLSETTVIVFWGDHGMHLGDHSRWAKHTLMERATSCPLIIYDPRHPTTPTTNRTLQPASTLDIYPTLCELAGLPIPQQPLTTNSLRGRPIRGRSLVPLMQNPSRAIHQGVVTHFNESGQYGYAYRTQRFRYIEWINATGNMNDGNARRDLYDYLSDPLETKNLATDPAYAGIVYQLSRSLRAETTVRGTGRLNLATPIATGNDAFLPGEINRLTSTQSQITWPGAGGVSYNLLSSTTLEALSWTPEVTNLGVPAVTIPLDAPRKFFRIGFGANIPPRFLTDPITKPLALVGTSFSDSLTSDAIDPGDTLIFQKTSGPAWLSVAANGAITGIPTLADAACANFFTIQVSDASANTASATLQITVNDPATNAAPAFEANPLVRSAATAGLPYADSMLGSASDPNPGHDPIYSLSSAPSWLIVSSTGELSGIPTAANIGLNSFTIRATDPLGAFTETVLQIQVQPGAAEINVATQTDLFGTSQTYGAAFFSAVTVQAGDMLVVAHAPNKNTATNTISMSGLGSNIVNSINSGSTTTTSSAWIFYSSITAAGTYNLVLDTSSGTKTTTHATSLFVLRTSGGTLQAAATDVSLATAAAPLGSLSLDFNTSPAVSNAYGIAAASTSGSSFATLPTGWTQEATSASKRTTLSNATLSGTSHSAPFTTALASDIALAGIMVRIAP